jgi:uracil-DNA glycosylase
MKLIGIFPFGQPVREVLQTDCTPKKVFLFGVYASAVHARWINPAGKTVVHALAVASEPTIFWRGEDAASIIQEIDIPKELGKLVPARQEFNGPSGVALDNLILKPLDLDRKEVWLCDLVPHSCINPSQAKAIERAYLPVASKFGLSQPSVPHLPNPLTDEARRNEIFSEIMLSEARTVILLGDLPVRWFLSYFDRRWSKLSDFSQENLSYGHIHEVQLGGKKMNVLPVAHPRQIAKLGQSSVFWYETHSDWVRKSANLVAESIKK